MASEKEMVFWGCVLFCIHEVIIAHQSILHLCDTNVYGRVLYMLFQMYSVCVCVCVCVCMCVCQCMSMGEVGGGEECIVKEGECVCNMFV